MNRMLEAFLFMAGFVVIMGGVGFIEESPLNLPNVLTGFGLMLCGIVLGILGALHYQFTARN